MPSKRVMNPTPKFKNLLRSHLTTAYGELGRIQKERVLYLSVDGYFLQDKTMAQRIVLQDRDNCCGGMRGMLRNFFRTDAFTNLP